MSRPDHEDRCRAPGSAAARPGRFRHRLRAASGALRAGRHGPTLGLGVLVLVTAFLAAAFPRAVDAYETRGARQALTSVVAEQRTLQISLARDDVSGAPGAAFAARETDRQDRAIRGRFTDPLRVAAGRSVHGVRTTTPLAARDSWLPRPDGEPPRFTVAAASGLAAHSTRVTGRLPRAAAPGARTLQAAVSTASARTLGLRVGSTLHLDGLTVRICGLFTPRAPEDAYWSVDAPLATPSRATTDGPPPLRYWQAGLLLHPGDGPRLASAAPGKPEKYWWYELDGRALTARQAPALRDLLLSVEHGAGLARIRSVAGEGAVTDTPADGLIDAFERTRATVAPVIAVAAFGVGTVAAVVLLMTGALTAAGRRSELALLRARGASLAGLTGRLAAATAAAALPGAAVGGGLALLLVPGERTAVPVLAAACVGVVGTLALPLRAAVAHRRPRPAGREDLAAARPSRRCTVAELTVVVLAAVAVLALRSRGTASGGVDALASAAPVLIGVIAALVLLRLYPLPLRLAVRPAARTAGLLGFLSLARAGRAPATAGLPLLALLVALTTASFGGSVLAGVAHGRDRAALAAVGAEARISGDAPLPKALAAAVAKVPGVTGAVPVQLGIQAAADSGPPLTLVIADADRYAGLSRATGLGAFPAGLLDDPGGSGPLPALVSPGVVTRFGHSPMTLQPEAGQITVRPVAVRADTPALPGGDFIVLDVAGVARLHPDSVTDKALGPTLLLASGSSPDPGALRAAVRAHTPAGASVHTTLRAEARAGLADPPLQEGAQRLYTAAVGAGAGFALLALLLSLLQAAPERAQLLGRLRTLGLTARQGRRLMVLEALPQALLAALGGALVGVAAIRLLGPGTDLAPLAFPGASGDEAGTVHLRTDPASLLLPSVAVVVLALAVALTQAWLSGRRHASTEWRAGDTR
ncbi:FtsX-like permease family protein [Streptomyces sp. NPDC050161]|uniref:FtsX-like permease family protein n=1 Tax=Streptomyces sp. NPDC050161 TaxID=3365604 RepID=UPI0037ADC515